MQEPGKESDVGEFYLEFDGSMLVGNALFALLAAPIIPTNVSGYMMAGLIALCGFLICMFHVVRHFSLKSLEIGDSSAIALTYTDPGLYRSFNLASSTILLVVVAIMWMGFAKLLWVLESFFPVFAAMHCLTTTAGAFMDLRAVKVEIDESNKTMPGG